MKFITTFREENAIISSVDCHKPWSWFFPIRAGHYGGDIRYYRLARTGCFGQHSLFNSSDFSLGSGVHPIRSMVFFCIRTLLGGRPFPGSHRRSGRTMDCPACHAWRLPVVACPHSFSLVPFLRHCQAIGCQSHGKAERRMGHHGR